MTLSPRTFALVRHRILLGFSINGIRILIPLLRVREYLPSLSITMVSPWLMITKPLMSMKITRISRSTNITIPAISSPPYLQRYAFNIDYFNFFTFTYFLIRGSLPALSSDLDPSAFHRIYIFCHYPFLSLQGVSSTFLYRGRKLHHQGPYEKEEKHKGDYENQKLDP